MSRCCNQGSGCSCNIVAQPGSGTTVTGTGSPSDPFVIGGSGGGGGGAQGKIYKPNDQALGVSEDTATITVQAASNPTLFNRSYARGLTADPPETIWPVSTGRTDEYLLGAYSYQDVPQRNGVRLTRFMSDSPNIGFYCYPAAGSYVVMYVDGAPMELPGTLFVNAVPQNVTIEFDDQTPKTRLIELWTDAGFSFVYCSKPGKIWRPEPLEDICLAIMGDSSVTPTVASNTLASMTTKTTEGMWQSAVHQLGVEEVITSGIGGSGYITPGGFQNYYDRRALLFDRDPAPDVLVTVGGGANDLVQGNTVSAIVAQAITYYTEARIALPTAKLVFTEGFISPILLSTFRDEYIDIRQQLQAALVDVGVYYIDVATTSPWINGLGYVTNPNVDGENSSTYIGYDGVHLTVLGNVNIGVRMAAKIRTVLNDDGSLVNTLI